MLKVVFNYQNSAKQMRYLRSFLTGTWGFSYRETNLPSTIYHSQAPTMFIFRLE